MATYSIISAYSFNNTVNDINTTNANNLTANGAPTMGTDSPFGNSGVSSTLDYAIVSATPTFSTNTTVTVQVPEGCTIPTSGGVANVQYSGLSAPYGFPRTQGKWVVQIQNRTNNNGTATYSNVASIQLNVPIGEWKYERGGYFEGNTGSGYHEAWTTLSTNTSAEIDNIHTIKIGAGSNLTSAAYSNHNGSGYIECPTATIYYLLARAGGNSTVVTVGGVTSAIFIRVIPAAL